MLGHCFVISPNKRLYNLPRSWFVPVKWGILEYSGCFAKKSVSTCKLCWIVIPFSISFGVLPFMAMYPSFSFWLGWVSRSTAVSPSFMISTFVNAPKVRLPSGSISRTSLIASQFVSSTLAGDTHRMMVSSEEAYFRIRFLIYLSKKNLLQQQSKKDCK